MKFSLIVFLSFFAAFSTVAEPSEKLIDAFVQVESNGRANAVGDNGKAVGCLQIWEVVVDDVNRFSPTKYSYEDRKSIIKSREICKKYLIHYGGKNATDEKYARIWNGGPKGYAKVSTRGYWRKVQTHLS